MITLFNIKPETFEITARWKQNSQICFSIQYKKNDSCESDVQRKQVNDLVQTDLW